MADKIDLTICSHLAVMMKSFQDQALCRDRTGTGFCTLTCEMYLLGPPRPRLHRSSSVLLVILQSYYSVPQVMFWMTYSVNRVHSTSERVCY